MRKVIKNDRSNIIINALVFLRNLAFHLIGISTYAAAIVLYNLYVEKGDMLAHFEANAFKYFYIFVAIPFINTVFQTIYTQYGWPWFRALMWWHTVGMLILIPMFLNF